MFPFKYKSHIHNPPAYFLVVNRLQKTNDAAQQVSKKVDGISKNNHKKMPWILSKKVYFRKRPRQPYDGWETRTKAYRYGFILARLMMNYCNMNLLNDRISHSKCCRSPTQECERQVTSGARTLAQCSVHASKWSKREASDKQFRSEPRTWEIVHSRTNLCRVMDVEMLENFWWFSSA